MSVTTIPDLSLSKKVAVKEESKGWKGMIVNRLEDYANLLDPHSWLHSSENNGTVSAFQHRSARREIRNNVLSLAVQKMAAVWREFGRPILQSILDEEKRVEEEKKKADKSKFFMLVNVAKKNGIPNPRVWAKNKMLAEEKGLS